MIRPMPRKMWYLITLSLPVLLAGIAFLMAYLGVNVIAPIFTLPMVVAGPQYAIFIIGFVIWAYNKPDRQIWNLRYWLPLLFSLPYLAFGYGCDFIFDNGRHGMGFWDPIVLIIGFPFVFIYGYFYVFLAHGLTWLFTKAGFVHA